MKTFIFFISILFAVIISSCASRENYPMVGEVIVGLPEHYPMLNADDYIISINGKDMKDRNPDTLRKQLLNSKFSDLELTVKNAKGEIRKDSITFNDWAYKILPFTCLTGDCKSGNGTAYLDEYIYSGPFLNGKPHGKGRSEYNTILEVYYYEGDWENGLYHGIGKLNNGDGYYEGGFLNGEKSGPGKLITTNAICEGTFWNNHMRRGTIKFQNENAIYTGETINDKPEGVGKKYMQMAKLLKEFGIWGSLSKTLTHQNTDVLKAIASTVMENMCGHKQGLFMKGNFKTTDW